jgi:nucleoside-diphosphate-sugar epimerase
MSYRRRVRVLVLGGTGFIGPDVVRELVARGHQVTIFHRGTTEPELGGARHLHGDRERLDQARDAFAAFAPEVALDMRPLVEADAVSVMRVLRGVVPRLVAISSADVYRAYGRMHGTEPGPPIPMPLAEDAPLRETLYPYRGALGRRLGGAPWMDDYDKIPIERRVLGDDAISGTVLRLPFVHGPRSYRYHNYLRRMRDGRSAILIGAAFAALRGTRGYVSDVARAIALAVETDRAAGRVYNVGEREPMAEADVARAIGRAAGWSGEVVAVDESRVPRELAERLPPSLANPTAHDLVLDTSRIRSELGYRERVQPADGFRRAVEWMDAHPAPDGTPATGVVDYAAEDELLRHLGRIG